MRPRFTVCRAAVPALLLGLALGSTPAAAQEGTPDAGGPPLPPNCSAIAENLINPRYVAVADDGTVYVTENGTGGDELLDIAEPGSEAEESADAGASPAVEIVEDAATPEASAEQGPPPTRGDTGQVTKIAPDGTQSVLATGLPSYSIGAGPHGIVVADDQIWVAIGGVAISVSLVPLPNENSILRIDPASGEVTLVAELGSYEADNNPDGTDVNSNIYGLALGADGRLYAADAGANTIYSVDPASGEFSLVGVIPGPALPGEAAADGATPAAGEEVVARQSVPTGIAVGPDGTLYAALLAGEPNPPGSTTIVSVATDGTVEDIGTGLTWLVGVAVAPDGTVYGSQLSDNLEAEQPEPGSVQRIGTDGAPEPVLEGLVLPHGITVDGDGNLYVVTNSLVLGPGAPQGQVLRCDGVGAADGTPAASAAAVRPGAA